MKAKIFLFVGGALAAGGAFWAYQAITGTSVSITREGAKGLPDEDFSHGFVFENRSKDQEIESRITAERALPVKDPDHPDRYLPGRYSVEGFRLLYNLPDNMRVVIEASSGELDVEQTTTKKKMSMTVRSGMLVGGVTITYGSRDVVDENEWVRKQPMQPGQVRTTIMDGVGPTGEVVQGRLKMDWVRRLLSSGDKVVVKAGNKSGLAGGMEFTGSDFKMAMDMETRRVDFLRLEHGERVVIKPDDAGQFNFNAGKSSTRPATGPAATGPSKVAATKPDAKSATRTTYKIVLEKDVVMKRGADWLKSDEFQATVAFGSGGKVQATQPATTPGTVAATGPSTERAGASDFFNFGPGGKDDAVITWSGKLEMRPVEPEDRQLADGKDLIIEAKGTKESPLAMNWNNRTVSGGRVFYQKSTGDAIVEASAGEYAVVSDQTPENPLGSIKCLKAVYHTLPGRKNFAFEATGSAEFPVMLAGDASKGAAESAVCMNLTYRSGEGQAYLAGPGRVEFPGSMMGLDDANPLSKKPSVTTFTDGLALELGTAENPKDATKPISFVRHVVIKGNVQVTHPTFSMHAGNGMDFTMAHVESDKAEKAGEMKMRQGLEHLMAKGGVEVKYARPGLTIAEADRPDSIDSKTLELLSKPSAKGPVMDQMVAENSGGVVKAVMHQVDKDNKDQPGRVLTDVIETPKLVVFLQPKEKAVAATGAVAATRGAADAASGKGGLDAREIRATGGVKLSLEGYASLSGGGGGTVVATCGELVAFPKANNSGTARLTGTKTADGFVPVKLVMGENLLEGPVVDFNQEARTVAVPGAGQMYFVDASDKAAVARYRVLWQDGMTFDQKTEIGHFTGKVRTNMEGKPDQRSAMTCNNLSVALLSNDQRKAAATAAATVAANKDSGKMALKEMLATGNVEATGETLDADGKLLTRVKMNAETLRYAAVTQLLEIPTKGEMTVEDYRPASATTKAAAGGPDSMGQTRGFSGLQWAGNLTYAGDTGVIEAHKMVKLSHLPPTDETKAAETQPKSKRILLQTENMQAKVEKVKDANAKGGSDPMATAVKFTNFTATGHPVLTADAEDYRISGDKFDVDPVTSAAVVSGNVVVEKGNNLTMTDWAKIDFSKGAFSVEMHKVQLHGGQ